MFEREFFLKQIENKQPVQTSFRYVYRESSFLGTVSKQVGMSPDVRQKEMCVQLRIFHLKQRAQNEQAWFKQESRKDNLGNKPQRLCCFLRFAGAKVGT